VLRFPIRDGELPEEPWVYAWLAHDGVVYVGATALRPETRTWLHLHDERPEIGRMRARFPALETEDLEVVAMPLPDGVNRQQVRHGSVTALGERGLLSPRHVCDPPQNADPDPQTDRFVELVAESLGE
jgi:hypothetical protein